ncbi:MAG: hypothetical protein QNK42_13585 [Pseudodonghicola sp.]|nr:hypothetical protein [Pseudodonghicola sp.]
MHSGIAAHADQASRSASRSYEEVARLRMTVTSKTIEAQESFIVIDFWINFSTIIQQLAQVSRNWIKSGINQSIGQLNDRSWIEINGFRVRFLQVMSHGEV